MVATSANFSDLFSSFIFTNCRESFTCSKRKQSGSCRRTHLQGALSFLVLFEERDRRRFFNSDTFTPISCSFTWSSIHCSAHKSAQYRDRATYL
ncbi:hypothetical protein FGO68_gene8256 [Halteria grandinella]|uniref:Uncharacterized protein n=1 Tax=Halteria grandinella TaxID=5974 RepID=A0A8J8N9V1_HALGN|nr:hypothetical protein FGO68_gene8256 [Halteria grandinella]